MSVYSVIKNEAELSYQLAYFPLCYLLDYLATLKQKSKFTAPERKSELSSARVEK